MSNRRLGPLSLGFICGFLTLATTVLIFWHKAAGIENQEFYQLDLFDTQGNKADLSILTGRPVIVNYWATWCKPCIEEFTSFENARYNDGSRPVFIMISDEPLDKVRAFVKKNRYDFKFYVCKEQLHINVRPITLFYDEAHKICAKHVGTISEDALSRAMSEQ